MDRWTPPIDPLVMRAAGGLDQGFAGLLRRECVCTDRALFIVLERFFRFAPLFCTCILAKIVLTNVFFIDARATRHTSRATCARGVHTHVTPSTFSYLHVRRTTRSPRCLLVGWLLPRLDTHHKTYCRRLVELDGEKRREGPPARVAHCLTHARCRAQAQAARRTWSTRHHSLDRLLRRSSALYATYGLPYGVHFSSEVHEPSHLACSA